MIEKSWSGGPRLGKYTRDIQQIRQERGWRIWLISKPIDWVTTPLYIGITVSYFVYYFLQPSETIRQDWWKGPLIALSMLSLAFIDRFEFWLYGEKVPFKKALGLLLLRVLFIQAVVLISGYDFSDVLYTLMPLTVSTYFGMVACYWVAALNILYEVGRFGYTTQIERKPDPAGMEGFISYILILVFIIALAKVINEEKKMRNRAELLLDELADSHRQVAELATTEERNRIAREIHDSLGHYLTVVNIQLEKAITFRTKNPEEAEQAVVNAKRLANEALEEVRRSVGTLRKTQSAFSLKSALGEMLENMQGHTLSIDLIINGSENGFSSENLMILYRGAQEAMTNIQRHSKATKATLALDFTAQEGKLRVSDNGRGFKTDTLQPGIQGGFGLLGLRERVELVGGSLAIESQPEKGTSLTLSVPKNPLFKQILSSPKLKEVQVSYE